MSSSANQVNRPSQPSMDITTTASPTLEWLATTALVAILVYMGVVIQGKQAKLDRLRAKNRRTKSQIQREHSQRELERQQQSIDWIQAERDRHAARLAETERIWRLDYDGRQELHDQEFKRFQNKMDQLKRDRDKTEEQYCLAKQWAEEEAQRQREVTELSEQLDKRAQSNRKQREERRAENKSKLQAKHEELHKQKEVDNELDHQSLVEWRDEVKHDQRMRQQIADRITKNEEEKCKLATLQAEEKEKRDTMEKQAILEDEARNSQLEREIRLERERLENELKKKRLDAEVEERRVEQEMNSKGFLRRLW